jgi:hypothetical protein
MARRLCALMRIKGLDAHQSLLGEIDNLAGVDGKFLAGLSFHGGDSLREAILFVFNKY